MVKPISLSKSIWYFLISSIAIYAGLHAGIPFLQGRGVPFFVGYLIFFHGPLVLLLVTALILYRLEGNAWTWTDFADRTWLTKMSGTDWLWATGLFIFGVLTYFSLAPVGKILAQIPFFSPPDFFPAEINPNKIPQPGFMMDYQLSGQYWIAPIYLIAWFFNISGEEILWRGILFPRQIKRYGSRTWVYHGVIWTLWHFFWTWNLVSILPWSLALSYVVYRRQNVWISIIAHGTMNFIPLVMIIIEILK
jgi:membrane protease YdiL (CAAX protease family)